MIQKHLNIATILFLISTIHLQAQPNKKIKIDKNSYWLVWHDEFNNDGIPDSTNWNYEEGFVRNNELQWYQAENATCENGKLVISAQKTSKPNPNFKATSNNWRKNRKKIEYTSACLISKEIQEWPAFGYYEIRARIDTSKGSWPAIWLLGTQGEWPNNGEIDIMEFYRINNKPHILANVAWGTHKKYTPEWDSEKIDLTHFLKKNRNWTNEFHTWSMLWDSLQILIYLDNELLNTIELNKTLNADGTNPFTSTQNFYLLLNLAIGSNGGDPSKTKFPITYEIDYVRIYKKSD